MRLSTALMLSLLFCSPFASAQITPIWTSDESETLGYDGIYGATAHALLANGDALMLAGETSRNGMVASVRLNAVGDIVLGQIGQQPLNSGRLDPEQILATQGENVIAAMIEENSTRALVAKLDTTGQLQWARALHGREARFFANGDVLLASGNELMRLKGSNGDPIWIRNLLDIKPNPVESSFWLPAAVEDAIVLGVSFREHEGLGADRFPDPTLLAIDPANGATLWQRDRAASSARVSQSCDPVALGGDRVFAWFELQNGQTDIVFERRSNADGALIWSTRVSHVDYSSDGLCAFVASSHLLALSSRDQATQTTLVALNHAGMSQWRQNLPSTLPAKLLAAADGAILVASQRPITGGFLGTLVERYRVSDGQVDWSFEIPGKPIEWQLNGSELRIAHPEDDGVGKLHLLRVIAETGTAIVDHEASAIGLALRPTAIQFIDGIPFAVMADRGVDHRSVRVRRLHPDTGAVIWSREKILDETPDAVTGVLLTKGPAGRLFVTVSYHLPEQGIARRQSLLAIDSGNGDLIWQVAQTAAPPGLGTTQALAVDDGSVFMEHADCSNPPICNDFQSLVSRLAAANGSALWTRAISGPRFLSVRGNDLALLRSGIGSEQVAINGSNGSDLWSLGLSAFPSSGSAAPTIDGDIASQYQFISSGIGRIEVQCSAAPGLTGHWPGACWPATPATRCVAALSPP